MSVKAAPSKRKAVFCFAVTAAYFLLNLYLCFCHESWRDEAQAWLIARDLSIGEIFYQMRFEGHPCLWHLLLAPLAKLGLPYASMKLLSLLLVTAAVYLFLRFSPFSAATNVFTVFSVAFVYFLPCVSRSYSLIPILIVLIASLFNNKASKPLLFGTAVALLIQTHIYLLGFCFALCVVWAVDVFVEFKSDKSKEKLLRNAFGLLLPLISALLLFLLLSSSLNTSSAPTASRFSYNPILAVWLELVGTIHITFGGFSFEVAECITIIIVLFVAAIFSLVLFSKSKPSRSAAIKTLFIYIVGTFFQLTVYALFYSGIVFFQKFLILFFIFLFSMWVLKQGTDVEDGKASKRINLFVLAAVVAISIVNYKAVFNDISGKYSASKEAAMLIEEYVPTDAVIISCDYAYDSSIIPYLDNHSFVTAGNLEEFTFVTWSNEFQKETSFSELKRAFAKRYSKEQGFYLLYSDSLLSDFNSSDATLVFEAKDDSVTDFIKGESYVMYYIELK